jgi:glycosyltransferase involved in cell wall biosynthesis
MQPKRKKILYIVTKSNFGGAQRYVYELATSLPLDRYEVAVACGGDGLLVTMLRVAGVSVYTIPSFARDIDLKKEITAVLEIWRILREFQPTIVHLNSSKAGGTGALLARLFGVPHVIFTAHGWPFFEKKSIVWRSLAWLFSWVTALLVHTLILVSKHDKAHMHMPFVQKKCRVIHPALFPTKYLPRHDARAQIFPTHVIENHIHDTWVVTVAELTSNKNVRAGIEAIRLYNKTATKKVFYTVIGDGELGNVLRETYREETGTWLYFLGYLPEARTYLTAFDIFLLTSTKEGFPYTLLEAHSAGCFLVASNVGGIPEIITNPAIGILINPQDPVTILNAIRESQQRITTSPMPLSSFYFDHMLRDCITLYESRR